MPISRYKLFYQAVDAAVADIRRHGFDSQARVDRWMATLRRTAQASMDDPAVTERRLTQGMRSIYSRLVRRREILKRNPGVSHYTLARVEPRLRVELDRRIMGAANLIKLNRTQAIEDTLQRFAGWATSVPAGGTKVTGKAETKDDIRKALGQLPFRERRVAVDQGHKFATALSEIVATDGGAIAAIWRSNWRQIGYNFREDHKDRDGRVYLIRGSWAHRQGLVKPDNSGFTDQVTAPGEEILCRCWHEFLFNLRDLPSSMLTKKGRDSLAETRVDAESVLVTPQSVNYRMGTKGHYCASCTMYLAPRNCEHVAGPISPRGTCDDHVDKAMAHAVELDRCGYFEGIKVIRNIDDPDKWNSCYDPDADAILIEAKFYQQSDRDRTRGMLHELGHRGQDVDPACYQDFKDRHLDTIDSFVVMANPVHLEDFKRTGKVDGLASEVFAESYARAMMGMPLPESLAMFWQERVSVPAS